MSKQISTATLEAAIARAGALRSDIIRPTKGNRAIVAARAAVIRDLHSRGYAAYEIGKKIGRNHSTVLHWIKRRDR